LDKNRLIERIVLEVTISKQIRRMFLFFLQIFVFTYSMSHYYSSKEVSYVHASLQTSLELDELSTSATAPEIVDLLRGFLQGAGKLAPNSAALVDDPGRRAYLPEPVEFKDSSTEIELASDVSPEVKKRGSFTLLVWVRSERRVGPLVTKSTTGQVAHTCWEFALEYFSFGGHEGKMERIIHPLARDMYHPSQDSALAWERSRIRSLEDGAWHHVGIAVSGDGPNVRFIADGEYVGSWQPMPRAITDCIGRTKIASAVQASLYDLQWFPAVLTEGEVQKTSFRSARTARRGV
jgi:hypothetical protein